MGNSSNRESVEYGNILRQVKESIKNKSVYQYQIAHFKILNIEKRIVPTAEYIKFVKIKKIMTSKRLSELKKILIDVKSQYDESAEIEKLKSLETRLNERLKGILQAKQSLIDEETCIKGKKRFLEQLEEKKRTLTNRNQFLEMKLLKADYNKRFSIQAVSIIKPINNSTKKQKAFSQFIINQRIENCSKCLERLEKMNKMAENYKLENLKTSVAKLEKKIFTLETEKKKTIEIEEVDLVERNNSLNIDKLLEDINFIKSERIKCRLENEDIIKRIESAKAFLQSAEF